MVGIMTPGLAIIAAVARNGVIGVGNALPWRIPDDLARFKRLTTGHAVVMGRKTWESLPRPLPDRQNIVVTRTPGYVARGAEVVASLPAALACADRPAPVFCIGGGQLYALALPLAQVLHLTEIEHEFAGDAHFPAFSRTQWRETARETRTTPPPDAMAYSFVTYERRG
jgi:dihydrofolate reductase